jgi:hypothetical protein
MHFERSVSADMQIDRSLVQGFDLFGGMSDDAIDDMLVAATSRRYPVDEIVFEQGAAATHEGHRVFLARLIRERCLPLLAHVPTIDQMVAAGNE